MKMDAADHMKAGGFRERFDRDIGKQKPKSSRHDEPLPYVDLSLDLVEREWLVPERIPMRNVTLLSGEGSIGKSLLLMQLSGAVVLGQNWLGIPPVQGPVLYVSCEEDDDEIRRRMEAIARSLISSRAKMIEGGLRFISLAGHDAILGQPDRNGIIKPTPLFERLRFEAAQLRPKLIVLDTVADTFGGKEIDRSQTRQFITQQRGLAIETNSALMLAAHPSLTGIATDTGLSGSTGWHNGVRARMYLKSASDEDPSLRALEVKKNNYGPVTETILLRWQDGVYRAEGVGAPEEQAEQVIERLKIEEEVEKLFLTMLRRFAKQGRNVTDKKGSTFAPAIFADQPEAKQAKATNKALTDAMTRLFAAERIGLDTEGPPSRRRTKIVEKEKKPTFSTAPSTNFSTTSRLKNPPESAEAETRDSNSPGIARKEPSASAQNPPQDTPSTNPSTSPSTSLPPSSTNLATHPPYTPLDGGRGKGLGGSPPLPPSKKGTPKGKSGDDMPYTNKRATRSKSDDLLYEGEPVEVPDQGPDELDEHGASVSDK
jgi:RecA-family ATPase